MAISSPLLEASIDGAHGVLLSIQGGSDLGLFEINEAAQLVANSAAVDANIIFGAVIDDALGDEVRVTVIAAGFDEHQRPSRPAAVTAVPAVVDRSPAPQPARASGGVNGTGASGGGASANGGAAAVSGSAPGAATTGVSATAAWAGNGTVGAGRGTGENRPAAEPPASAAAASATPPGAAAAGGVNPAGTPGTWSVPSSSFSSGGPVSGSGYTASGSGYTASAATDSPAPARQAPGAGQPGHPGHAGAAGPVSEAPAAPASDGPSGYVPAPVSFVSEDDEEYGAKPGYGGYDSGRGGDAAQGGAAPSWKDSGRAGKQDKVFDVTAGRRRPVVFEEEDDLDVPDFLK
jgi:cell division protein FtsZ